jgi:hypothetical protein
MLKNQNYKITAVMLTHIIHAEKPAKSHIRTNASRPNCFLLNISAKATLKHTQNILTNENTTGLPTTPLINGFASANIPPKFTW